MQAVEVSLVDQIRATSDVLPRLHRRYDATREDYLAALKPLEVARKSAARAALAARADLREILTREEWEQVFPPLKR